MMKIVLLVVLFAASSGVLCEDEVMEKLEKMNVKEVTKDEVLMKKVFSCLMDEEPCGDFQYLRGNLY